MSNAIPAGFESEDSDEDFFFGSCREDFNQTNNSKSLEQSAPIQSPQTDNSTDTWTEQKPQEDKLIDIDENDSDIDNDENVKIYGDLELFLSAILEDDLIDVFKNHKVTLSQLLQFDEQDLINVGLGKVGDRKKVLDTIAQVHATKWEPTSFGDLTSRDILTGPGIYIVLNDINKHMEYIGASFSYLSLRLHKNPAILELGKDFVDVRKIKSELEDLIATSKTTYKEIIRLNNQLGEFTQDPIYLPANYIDVQHDDLRRSSSHLLVDKMSKNIEIYKKQLLSAVIATTAALATIKLIKHILF